MSGDLCEELIFEIFTRLPPKSLLRFRSLSKSLCSCIASPSFIGMHTCRSPQKILIKHLVYNKKDYLYTLHMNDQLPTRRRRYIGIKAFEPPCNIYSACVGSCNGIICLIDDENGINLWNPSIRRNLTLRDCLGRCSSRCPRRCSCGASRVSIGCGNEPIGIGFGFGPVTDDYKIVSLSRCGGTGESSYVYTMKTDAWCAITSPTPLFCKVTSRGCFLNGALHWVVQGHFPESDDVNGHYILTFDLSTHVFGMIALPQPRWRWKTKQLTIIQGSLAVISSVYGDSCVWVMKEYKNTDSSSVFFEPLFLNTKMYEDEEELQKVLQPTSNSDLLLFETYERFQVYDPKIGAQYSGLKNLDDYSFTSDMETCVESLQLLDMGTACQPSIRLANHQFLKKKTGAKKLKHSLNGCIHVSDYIPA